MVTEDAVDDSVRLSVRHVLPFMNNQQLVAQPLGLVHAGE